MNSTEVAVTILRLPMVYGPGDPLHRFYAYLHRMDSGRPVIVLDARLAQWRSSYGYVENVAWGIALAAMKQPGDGVTRNHRIYNLSEPEALSEQERLMALAQTVGWQGKIIAATPAQLPSDWQLPLNLQQDWTTDSTCIRQELGYQEPVVPAIAFKKTVDWERQFPPADIQQSASAICLLDPEIENQIVEALQK